MPKRKGSEIVSKIVTCGICLEDIPESSLTHLSNCSHMFCQQCIYQWEEQNNTCPTCRRSFDYMVVPSNGKRRIVECHSKERKLLESSAMLYIMSARYRSDIAVGCLRGDATSCVIFEYMHRIIPFIKTENIQFSVSIMQATDAIVRLRSIYRYDYSSI